ncbi:MAG: sigma-70 family RNA polymerase sigma factor, partial [Planctomycetota bacterium]
TASDVVIDSRRLLFRIATRRAMDRLRRRYRDRELHVAYRSEDVSSPSVGERAELQELREAVRRVLATLPPQQSEAFLLRYIEERSVADVASRMGIKPGNVRVLVHRAMAVLRQSLTDDTPVQNDAHIQKQGS